MTMVDIVTIRTTMRMLALGAQFGNIILLSMLLMIYSRSYKQMKSKFTAGLIFFASFLLLQNLVSLGSMFIVREFRGMGAGPPFFLMGLLEFIGLAILLKITWE